MGVGGIEMLDQLKNLEMYLLITLCITAALTPFSIKNYLIYLFAKVSGGRYTQNTLGMFIDWIWLSSTIFLIIKLF